MKNTNQTLKLADNLLMAATCSIAYKFRFDTFILPTDYLLAAVALVFFNNLALETTRCYSKRFFSIEGQSKSILIGLFLGLLSTSLVLYLSKSSTEISRLWSLYSVVLSASAMIFYRVIAQNILRSSSGNRFIVVVGNNETSHRMLATLRALANPRIVVSRHFSELDNEILRYLELQRRPSDGSNAIAEVWFTHDIYNKLDVKLIAKMFGDSAASLIFIPELPARFSTSQPDIDFVHGIPTIDSRYGNSSQINVAIKYLEDLVLSFSATILLCPLLIITAIAIKLDSKGPVIFKQVRYGGAGEEFEIYKFRTMYASDTHQEFEQAKKHDNRITKVGAFLRRSSIDELPQIINVIKGQMSLVGPRPLPKELNEQYRSLIPGFMRRYNVKPGITGLAQINGARGETPQKKDMEKRIELDLEYVQNWTLTMDIRILLKTCIHIITTKQAY